METAPRNSWSSIALLILGLIGILFFWGIGALMIFTGLLNLANGVSGLETAQPVSFGVMFGVTGFLLIPGVWLAFRQTNTRLEPDGKAGLPFAFWHIIPIILVWAAALQAGQWASTAPDPAWILLPLILPFCVLPPIWLAIGLAGRGYNFHPQWRGWNTFTIGSTLGPFLIIVFEVIVLGMLALAAILYIALQPEIMNGLETLAAQVDLAQTEEQIIALMGPVIANPVFIAIVLFGVAVLVPLIEELFKPLAVWLFSRQLNTRFDGFVLGAISGAAYAVFETGGISAAAGEDWLVLLGARGGTSLLHIATSAWMGSAIVPAIRQHKWLKLLGVYAMAIFLHGTWNTFSIFNGFGPIAEGQPGAEWIVSLGNFSAFGLGALALIFLALIIHQQNRFLAEHQSLLPASTPIAPLTSPAESESTKTVIR